MAKYSDYFNEVTSDGRIFSYEDVINIPQEEDRFYREALDYQYGKIGFPTDRELQTSGDVVYVQAYTRDDGTHVRAHYRSKNGHLHSNPNKRTLGTPKEEKAYYDRLAEMGWETRNGGITGGAASTKGSTELYTNILRLSMKKGRNIEEEKRLIEFIDEYYNVTGFKEDYEKYFSDKNPIQGFINTQLFVSKYLPFLAKNFLKNRSMSVDYYNVALNNAKSRDKSIISKSVKSLKTENITLANHILKDMNFDNRITTETPLIIAAENSQLSNSVKFSKELQSKLIAYQNEIKKGELKNKIIPGLIFRASTDLGTLLGNAHIYDIYIDDEGCLNCTIPDYYDFKLSNGSSFIDWVNNAAYYQQEQGSLTNYVLLVRIKYDKEQTKRLLNG